SGPNQYWSTVDLHSVEAVEVVMGPGSVLYGTDAVGGVVNVIPPHPSALLANRTARPGWQYRYASAEDSHTGRISLAAAPAEHLGLAVGLTGKLFGDLRAGGGVGAQPKTGYDEWNVDVRAEYSPRRNSQLAGAYQRTTQEDVWRAHKTIYGISWEGTTVGSDRRCVLDQERDLGYARYTVFDLSGRVQRLSGTLSWHRQNEEQDRVKKDRTARRQGCTVRTVGLSVETELALLQARATVGIDLYRDRVSSWASDYDAAGALVQESAQGPVADRSTYDTWDFFAQAEWTLGRFSLLAGGRFSYVGVDAGRIQDPLQADRVYSLERDWRHAAATGRIMWRPAEEWRIYGGVSHAYRAPNLSDLTRFDIARTNELEIPAPDLEPETFLCYEAGVKTRRGRWSGEVAVFYTAIRDLIIRVPTGEMLEDNYVVTKRNAATGYVTGLEARAAVYLGAGLTVAAGGAWIDGRADSYPTSSGEEAREPLDRLMPPEFTCEAVWRSADRRMWAGGELTVAGRQDNLSAADRQDTQRIPPGGTPGYAVVQVRAGVKVGRAVTVSAALDNVFDAAYRIHGSGVNEPGRNLAVSLTWE
nr:TonB-dependent receptor [candidate division Zixibacteria bacterium]